MADALAPHAADGREAHEAGAPGGVASAVLGADAHVTGLLSSVRPRRDAERIAAAEQDDDVKRVIMGLRRTGLDEEETLVKREYLVQHLTEDVKKRYQRLHAPFIFLYYVFFVLIVLGHERLVDVSQVERELRSMLTGTTFEGLAPVKVSGHKTLGNIDTAADVYTYLRDAVMPLFLPSINGTARQDWSRVLRYNQLLGGLLLQQTRAPKRPCSEVYPGLGPFDDNGTNPLIVNVSCFPPEASTAECFGPGQSVEGFCAEAGGSRAPPRRLRPKKAAPGPKLGAGAWQIVTPPTGDRFNVLLYEHHGLEAGLRRLQQIQELEWIDEQTKWVGIRLFLINSDLGVYSSATVNIFALESGELLPLIQVFSFMAEPYKYKILVAVDCVWVILWFHLFGFCFWKLFEGCYFRKGRLDYLLSGWTWLGWATVIMGLVMIVNGLIYLEELDVIKDHAMSVAFSRPATTRMSPEMLLTYRSAVEKLHAQLVDFNTFMDGFRRYIGFYSVLLMFRFFRAFDVQPRLAVVMQTVLACMPDIVHFLIVLFTMHTVFVLSGMFLFGHRIIHFSRFDMAFEASMLMLFGSMNFKELGNEHPVTAMVWFSLFVIVMYMILVNMALAIFMDVYGGMKNKSDVSESVLKQLLGVFKRILKRKKLVPSSVLLESVERLDTEVVSKDVLVEVCPGLHEEQAGHIIENVYATEDFEESAALSLSDAFKMVGSIRNSVKDIKKQVDQVLLAHRALGTGAPGDPLGPGGGQRLHPESDVLLSALEDRARVLEEFLNEVMSYMVLRGKEARDRLEGMEQHLRNAGSKPSAANGQQGGVARQTTAERRAPTRALRFVS